MLGSSDGQPAFRGCFSRRTGPSAWNLSREDSLRISFVHCFIVLEFELVLLPCCSFCTVSYVLLRYSVVLLFYSRCFVILLRPLLFYTCYSVFPLFYFRRFVIIVCLLFHPCRSILLLFDRFICVISVIRLHARAMFRSKCDYGELERLLCEALARVLVASAINA